jgi:hypothetical protein
LYAQIVGKYRLARTPWANHPWHATLYVNAPGAKIPDGAVGVEIAFDLVDDAAIGATTDGRRAGFPLGPMSVAEFHARFLDLIGQLGGTPQFDGRPNEVPNPVPFRDDRQTRPYDADAVTRFFQAIVAINPRAESISHGIRREGQPSPSVLGQLRSRCDPLLRASCSAPSRWHSGIA